MLTPRERRALQGLAEGETVRATAQAMGITENGVYVTRHRVYRKLGLLGLPRRTQQRRAVWGYLSGEAMR